MTPKKLFKAGEKEEVIYLAKPEVEKTIIKKTIVKITLLVMISIITMFKVEC